jgi:AcrR family transcriptional regulator
MDSQVRRARADHILDVAAELLVRHGYRRVTIVDVAERAGVSKGTIYQHWNTRESLFLAVCEREETEMLREMLDLLRREPETALLHRLMRAIFVSVMRRPRLRALLVSDMEVLGGLAGEERSVEAQRAVTPTETYLELLAGHGLLRPGLGAEDVAYSLGAIFRGFLFFERSTPLPLLERRADVLAVTLRQAFEPDAAPLPGAVDAVAAAAVELFSGVVGEA